MLLDNALHGHKQFLIAHLETDISCRPRVSLQAGDFVTQASCLISQTGFPAC